MLFSGNLGLIHVFQNYVINFVLTGARINDYSLVKYFVTDCINNNNIVIHAFISYFMLYTYYWYWLCYQSFNIEIYKICLLISEHASYAGFIFQIPQFYKEIYQYYYLLIIPDKHKNIIEKSQLQFVCFYVLLSEIFAIKNNNTKKNYNSIGLENLQSH